MSVICQQVEPVKLSDGVHGETPGDKPDHPAVSDLAHQRSVLTVIVTPVG